MTVVMLMLTGAVVIYAAQVPLPDDPQVPQASVLYYRDGHTVLARLGTANRTDVPLSDVPESVRDAILAAEDRGYYDHRGLSTRGIARAAWANLFGGSQGASTITQQYVRNAYLTQTRTVRRKANEMVLSVKLERRCSKDEILQRYLNTIYFGRGAYGIAAAAKAYFGTTTDRLTVAQGAVLASIIKDPWGYDPAVDLPAAQRRWRWVVNTMASLSWLDNVSARRLAYPDVLSPSAAAESLRGPNGLIVDAVERELSRRGISPQTLRTAGLNVVTTIDHDTQQDAIDRMTGHVETSAGLRGALVSVDPATGGVRAYYGGRRGQGFYDDAGAPHPPASTFKPLVLAAGLGEGVSYLSRWDGSSPRVFPDRLGAPLHNRGGAQCPNCTLDESMMRSLNTPFYALATHLGAARVRRWTIDMGISPAYGGVSSMVDVKGEPRPGRTRADIALGRYPVSPADLASAYATLAAGGIRADRHFVESVTGIGGESWRIRPTATVRVVDRAVAADVTTVLHHVAEREGGPGGHPAALMTGTQQWGNTADNQDALAAGYTPQLATVVWIGGERPGPIRDAGGSPMTGDGLPARLWRGFMAQALDGKPPARLPAPGHVGSTSIGDAGAARATTPRPGTGTTTQEMTLVDRTRSGGKTVALTFDDGPSEYTGQVLDLLAQYGITATFCMVGDQVKDHPDAVLRLVAEGHALCNHSMHHDDLSPMTAAQVSSDLSAMTAAVLAAAPDARIDYFRAPYGSWGSSATVGADLGLTPLAWTVDPEDWNRPGADAIVQAAQERLEPGGIMLLHDGGGDRTQTVHALRTLIPQLLDDGWAFDLPAVTTATATATPTATPTPTASASAHTETPVVPTPAPRQQAS
ncbi:MAG: polysaccharide deacetylase family protein [Dactylosporangium sp.]|nr:transglycosylase domain-containing protein [Dactylosporangium sp.]NNJ63126.1 polysaccharide deacetylase family protein [Dactylosporangium sp.]